MNNRHRLVARLVRTHCKLTPEECQEIIALAIKAIDEWLNRIKNRPEMQDIPGRITDG